MQMPEQEHVPAQQPLDSSGQLATAEGMLPASSSQSDLSAIQNKHQRQCPHDQLHNQVSDTAQDLQQHDITAASKDPVSMPDAPATTKQQSCFLQDMSMPTLVQLATGCKGFCNDLQVHLGCDCDICSNNVLALLESRIVTSLPRWL